MSPRAHQTPPEPEFDADEYMRRPGVQADQEAFFEAYEDWPFDPSVPTDADDEA